ncbi:glycosyltransferase family 39 protein [Streptomyces antibioticus]|uniref:glycosyltransferase family 39 protein n=1 Tax=Streptomyces antibioticus TaxID=1890 RepID=UPI0033CEB8BC
MTILAESIEHEAGEQRRGVARFAVSQGLWAWPALATLALALFSAGDPLLGTDELVTWDVGRRSMPQLWGLVQNAAAMHGAYYALMHGWMAVFGDSPMAMRLPSALAMSVAAALVAMTGCRLFGRRAGLYGGLLFALIPVASRFGQEARGCAMVVMAVMLATHLLIKALDRPGNRVLWAGYALCVASVGLLDIVALLALMGHLLAVILRARHGLRVLVPFGLSVLAGVACVVPLAVVVKGQAVKQHYWVPKPDGWGLLAIWPQVFASAVCGGAVIALAALAWRENREGAALLTGTAVAPPLVLWLASFGDASYFRYEYLVFTAPVWATLAGAGIAGVTRSWLPAAAGLAVLAVLVLPDQHRIRGTFEHDKPHNANYAGAARIVELFHRPGDAAVLVRGAPWMLDQGIRYYLPRDVKLRDVFFAKSAADNNELYPAYCPSPNKCLKDEKRIWLVVPGSGADPFAPVPPNQAAALRARYATSWTYRLSGLTVTLLQSKVTG